MINRDDISRNLFGFYKEIAGESNTKLESFSGLEKVSANDNSWPAYVLSDRHVEVAEIQDICEKMKTGEYPPFWIRPLDENDDFNNLAISYGIRQINAWKGMSMELNKAFDMPVPQEDIVFERIQTLSEVENWVKVVNSEVMHGRKISDKVFKELLNKNAFDFFQLRMCEEVVSTMLMYNFKGVVGLYLLSTIEKFRGKGLGKFITSKAIDYYILKSYPKFVLHSTKQGYPLQQKLGFHDVCDYGIYWLVGKI